MALELSTKSISFFKVVSPEDPAFDKDHEKHNWDAYEKDCDLSHLVVKEGQQPTVFLCDFNLPARITAKIKNAMMGKKDDDGKASLSYGEWAYTCVQYALKNIENAKLEVKKDGTGRCMPEVMDQLERWGMIDEIFKHYVNQTSSPLKAEAKNS